MCVNLEGVYCYLTHTTYAQILKKMFVASVQWVCTNAAKWIWKFGNRLTSILQNKPLWIWISTSPIYFPMGFKGILNTTGGEK